MDNSYANYLRDIVYLLRERTARTAKENMASSSAFNEGREAALREVLAMMQNQADIFGIPRDGIFLDGFDALVGAVDPPKLERRRTPANES